MMCVYEEYESGVKWFLSLAADTRRSQRGKEKTPFLGMAAPSLLALVLIGQGHLEIPHADVVVDGNQ